MIFIASVHFAGANEIPRKLPSVLVAAGIKKGQVAIIKFGGRTVCASFVQTPCMKYTFLLLLVMCGSLCLMAQVGGDTLLTVAQRHFETIRHLSATRAAQLWGRELAGPVLLVEPATRRVYANQPDRQGYLTGPAPVYTGSLPVAVNIANTATEWAGVHWTMMLLPLPEERAEQEKLMAHELFHRIQPAMGFSGESPVCDHLDTQAGRTWFRLELAALAAAWRLPAANRRDHLQRAWQFRQWRYGQFPDARQKEEALEWNEGLAEFTGVYVSGIAVKDTGCLPRLGDSAAVLFPGFARSAAYLTGPLYGMLLSRQQKDWQRALQPGDNFPSLLSKYYQLSTAMPDEAMVRAAAKHYDGDRIMEEEVVREQKRLAKEKNYLGKLVDGPVLELTFTRKMSVSFNPGQLFPLGNYGTVYPTMTLTDEWGRLVVTGDALMHNWRRLMVSTHGMQHPDTAATGAATIRAIDWTLDLAPGWEIQSGNRAGDLVLRQRR